MSRTIPIERSDQVFLFDFTNPDSDTDGWTESSDTVRQPGKSKATLVIQDAQLFRRAIFFALLNPQPNGAGFAGVNRQTSFNLEQFSTLDLKLRAQGQFTQFKIVLRHHGQAGDSAPAYEQFFQAPTSDQLETVVLPLSDFKPYYRGQPLNDTELLDLSDITSFGIQFFGGVYSPVKQSGPATLEIDWIKATV